MASHGIPLVTVTPSPAVAVESSPAAGDRTNPERLPPGQFQDFDDEAVYNKVVAANLDINEQNFVVHFGADEAKIASNLTASELVHLLQQAPVSVRWINIWNPGKQRESVEAIGRHYGFSRRLTMSIWAWDAIKLELGRQRHASKPLDHGRGTSSRPLAAASPSPSPMLDLGPSRSQGCSDSVASKSMFMSPVLTRPAPDPDIFVMENLATFQTMQNSLNYTSIDQQNHFVCIGANWLHRCPLSDPELLNHSLVPPKHWSWFILCHDNTVISFHEAASFSKAPTGMNLQTWQAEELKNMRSNTLKVLRQLSKHGLEHDKHKFMQLTSIRQPMAEPATTPASLVFDAACNLFYYLFEDYSAAFDVLNGSRKALDTISSQIFEADRWKHKGGTDDVIPRLYTLNRDLRQLRSLFANYKTLIDRLLDSRPPGLPDAGSRVVSQKSMSTRARARFYRLQLQLQTLMLDTISDSLDEKASLQDTYFNLMTQKDSRATERLTRSATLLAKLSVFFLPISFMTSYFSVQIPHLTDGYTVRTYWGAFGVLASVSFLCLFFFGKVIMFLSERLDDLADATVGWLLLRGGWLAHRERKRAARASADDDEAY